MRPATWMLKLSRTAVLLGSVALAAAVPAVAQTKAGPLKTDEVVFVGSGGTYQAAQRKAFFEPFARATGIRFKEDTGNDLPRLSAEVQSGRPTVDFTTTTRANYNIGESRGLWAPINYGYFDPKDLAAMPAEAKQRGGVGAIYYSDGMAFNTNAFPDGGPQPHSWVDFWDLKKFPGKRGLPRRGVSTNPLPEVAQLAMGVPRDKIYDHIDLNKIVAKLKELGNNVVWWDNEGQPGEMLASGEVVMTLGATGREQLLADSGAPVRVVWNGARYSLDLWFVLRNAKNLDNAMRFIAFSARPEVQAEMAKLSHYAPTNPRAYDFLDKGTAEKLVTYPSNFKQTFSNNEKWWTENREKWDETCMAALLQ